MIKTTIAVLCAAMMLFAGACAEGGPIGTAAEPEDMTQVEDLTEMYSTPVTADMLREGVYEVVAVSSSSMFKVVGCALTVSEEGLKVRLYMKSRAYSYMYPGTAEDAALTPVDALVPLCEDERGMYFELPAEALDVGYTCAALSERKQVWYPRTLVFRSDALPAEAFREEFLVTAASLSLADGQYTCEAVLEGRGKTSVRSPAAVTCEGEVCTARVVLSTSKADYVIYGGEKYLPVSTEGGAAFDLPVSVFDRKLSLIVDSTAITPAAEVPYSITFFSGTIARTEGE